jgi:hypothetical protein
MESVLGSQDKAFQHFSSAAAVLMTFLAEPLFSRSGCESQFQSYIVLAGATHGGFRSEGQ